MTGLLYALASGLMVSASVFTIAVEGLHLGGPLQVGIGFVLGGAFIATAAARMPVTHSGTNNSSRSMLVLLALFVHSIPEGIAIGVGFATGEVAFGLALAIAIAIHNIPEGTTMSLPLRQDGASMAKCFWYSVFTSAPQAVLALPAFYFASSVEWLIPGSLAFAGGAMIYLVVFDLLPEAFENCESRTHAAWGFLLGLTLMMIATTCIQRITNGA